MESYVKFIIGLDLILFALIVFAFVAFFVLFHSILYLLRWYEYANSRSKPDFKINAYESAFFFILETGASTYLHFLMILRSIKLILSRNENSISIISGTERNPVILIHGYQENNGTMSYLKRSLQAKYGFFNIFNIEYGTPFTFDYIKIRTRFRKGIIQIFSELGEYKADFVCHSMGGLMLLEFLSENEEYHSRVSRIVLLGTPLNGSKLAVFNRNSVAKNLRPGSELIKSISFAKLQGLTIFSVYSTFDELVLPYDSSRLPEHSGFYNIEFDNIGHMGLLMANRIISKMALLLIE